MAEVIVGAVIALFTGVIVPFATTQYSLWAEHKRALYESRRTALAAVIAAQAAVHERTAEKILTIQASGAGGSAGPDDLDDARIRSARQRLRALMTTSDRHLVELLDETGPKSPYATPYLGSRVEMILATWAAGRDWRAKRATVRYLVEIRIRQQRDEGQPKRNHTAPAHSQTDQ